ncbi:MAG TPA: carbamoyltransferase [Candidatus Sumerlaeota bacterium]|nr:MAG: Decarbamoylnovobiocin carbamoyltransferase [candidate division BRC1 bacterium ADurb.Bin183]HOE62505.1 carbamoyltransferase [Candidatus Sumerlaeota bacterium]HRR30419.1 carbamoyltransferase [Candidatus Sumerlaeia bacterium]HON50054.1 carbamoyltransferase [Candidatus Sumerlaeota bacterium]HOR63270.1 carbamoyltransferase [Candidatus Sumerlaeota bacterium]
MTHIIGISAFYHDSAACLVTDGKIIAAAQEERFTRKKHDANFPSNAIRYCLKAGGITSDDIDFAVFYDKPFVKFWRLIETYIGFAPRGLKSFIEAAPLWVKQKLWIKELIRKEIGGRARVLFPEHHASHAASAFYPSPFQKAAILTIDGVGEWATASYGIGEGNKIRLLAEMEFPHSLGLFYSAFTFFTGFKVNSGEYKMMGLAPYGEAKFKDIILKEIIDLKEDGSLQMNMDFFDYCAGLKMTNEHFDKLFGGPPRKPETKMTQREMDIARSAQEVTEEIIMRMARHLHKETGAKNLCLAGGVALNCVGNGRLLKDGPFDDIWIQPAAGDAGGALGAALLAWHQHLGHPRHADNIHDFQQGSLLGPEFSDAAIKDFLKRENIPYTELDDASLIQIASDLLANEKVIGWFQGRMEFGPRALGNRSIIGDARSSQMQSLMNLKIKFRESFRPFAPSVLEEKVSDYFELEHPSPYMLLVAQVKKSLLCELSEEEKRLSGFDKLRTIRSSIPAITHVDNSARLQTVHKDVNPRYHALIKAFEEKTGCAVIINTSFNVRGEPIVCAPEEAYRCFMRTRMDYLFLGNIMLDKKEQPQIEQDEDWQKEYELD